MLGLSPGTVVVVVVAAVAAGSEVFVCVFVAVSCCIIAVGTVRNLFIHVVVHVLVANDILFFCFLSSLCSCVGVVPVIVIVLAVLSSSLQ